MVGLLLKFGIVALALFFLYEQLTSRSTIDQFNSDVVLQKIKQHYYIFIVVILMMFLNWFLEALKWRFLISKIEKISIGLSIRAIFSGITIAAFTPNRVGEYGGRVFCLKQADRMQAVLITVIGSMAQLLTTIFFGSVGLLFLPKYNKDISTMLLASDLSYPIIVFLLISLNAMLLFFFLNTHKLSVFLSKLKCLKKYDKYHEVFSFYNSGELARVIYYSIARYIVFTSQFFILLHFFDVNINYSDAIVLIMVMLLMVSVIPTIAITEIGIRGSLAIFLFGLVSSNDAGILSATFIIWIINLLLPALIGTFFVFSLKFFRK